MAAWIPLLVTLSLVTGRAVPVDTLQERTGTPCGDTAVRVADLQPGPTGSEPRELVHGARGLFFTADDGVHGRELWLLRGTGVRDDEAPGRKPWRGGGAGTLDDESHGRRPWRGGGADPVLVKDVRPGARGSGPRSLTMMGGTLYFLADDGVHGLELWRSDGTEAGTRLVRDLHEGAEGSNAYGLVEFGGRLWFSADDGVHGTALWASDGTEAGTVLVKQFSQGRADSFLTGFTVAGGALYIVSSGGPEATLWRYDGAAFTEVLREEAPFIPYALKAVGERLFFLLNGDEEPGGETLYVTDGTPEGTKPLRTFRGSMPLGWAELRGQLVFVADDGVHGVEPWVSDGTEAGTRMVRDVRPGPEGSTPFFLTPMNGHVYFSADDGAHGRELWASDGTEAGTGLLLDVEPGGLSPAHLAVVDGTLFFSVETAEHRRELWHSDGTAAGTHPQRSPVAESLTLTLSQGERGHPRWQPQRAPLSATASATVPPESPREFARSGADVFFVAEDPTAGEELWVLPLRPESRCATP